MSLRSRARNVQRAANLPYQKAVAALRALGEKPAELSAKHGWPLGRADLYLVDKALDAEYCEVAERGRPVVIASCAECRRGFFLGVGSPEIACPEHRGSSDERALRRACEAVRARSGSLAVAVLLRDGCDLAWAGARDGVTHLAVQAAIRRPIEPFGLIEVRGGAPSSLVLVPVADAAVVAVHFDDRTSLGVVRLTVRPLVDLLAKRLRTAPPEGGGPTGGGPTGGGRGPSGAGANAWEVRPFMEAPPAPGDEIVIEAWGARRRDG
jgi:hypothetical protein